MFVTSVLHRWFPIGRPRQLTTRAAYSLWSDTYPPWAHNPLMEVEQAAVTPILTRCRAARALDLGTGSGRYLPVLASTGARVVIGLDFSMPMLRRGLEPAATPTQPGTHQDERAPVILTRVCADARRLPFADSSFDLVSASLMVGDVADLGSWVAEIARVLTPGGHLVYSDFHPSWATGRWRRTFRTAQGVSLELPYFPHRLDEHLASLADHGFTVRTIREPRLTPEQRRSPGPQAPGDNPPVVVVMHASKGSGRLC